MDKVMKMWMLAAILICSASLVGCGNKNAKPTENNAQTETPVQTEVVATEVATCYTAVDDYLVNEIGKNYAQSDVCIPYAYVISADEGNPDDILVWGDFWVFNYEISGDTLKVDKGDVAIFGHGGVPGVMEYIKK